jgi:hypothetical protein
MHRHFLGKKVLLQLLSYFFCQKFPSSPTFCSIFEASNIAYVAIIHQYHYLFFFFIWAFPLAPKLQKTIVFFSYVCEGSGFAPLRYRFGAPFHCALLLASHGYNP